MTKRVSIITIGIILVLLLAAPFAIGMLTESNMREQLDSYYTNDLFEGRVADYDRGWFSSTARIEFRLSQRYIEQFEAMAQAGGMGAALSGFNIPIVVEIAHGPVLTGETAGIGLVAVKAYADPQSPMIQIAQTFLGVPNLFEFRGRSGFGTGFVFEGGIPEIRGAISDFGYDFSGVDLNGVARLGDLEFEAVLGNLALQSPFASVIVDALTVTGDYERRPGQLMLGTSQVNLARVVFVNPLFGAEPAFAADKIGLSGTFSENGAGTHFDLEALFTLERVAVPDVLEIRDAALGLRIGHLDSTAVDEIYRIAGEIDPLASDATVGALLRPSFDRIVAGSPELALEPVRFTMPDGSLDARVSVVLDGTALPNGSVSDLENIQLAMSALTAEADITVDKPLARLLAGLVVAENLPPMTLGADGQPVPPTEREAMIAAQTSQMLTGFTTLGILSDTGDSYRCLLKIEDGAATANGQPVPFLF